MWVSEKKQKCKPNNMKFTTENPKGNKTIGLPGIFRFWIAPFYRYVEGKSHLRETETFFKVWWIVTPGIDILRQSEFIQFIAYCKGENQITLSLKEICVCYTPEYLSWVIEFNVIRVEFCIIVGNLTLKMKFP